MGPHMSEGGKDRPSGLDRSVARESTCLKGGKGGPTWHDRSVFMWVHMLQK